MFMERSIKLFTHTIKTAELKFMKAPDLKTLKLSLLGCQILSMEKVSTKGLKIVDIIAYA